MDVTFYVLSAVSLRWACKHADASSVNVVAQRCETGPRIDSVPARAQTGSMLRLMRHQCAA